MSEELDTSRLRGLAAGYRDRPEEMMEELKALWNEHRGSLIPKNSDLYLRLKLLSISFRGVIGYAISDGIRALFVEPEGKLWKACIAQGIPVVALDMMREDRLAEQSSGWIFAVLGLNAGFARVLDRLGDYSDISIWPGLPDHLEEQYLEALRPAFDALWRARSTLMPESDDSKCGRQMVHSITIFTYSTIFIAKYTHPDKLAEITSMPGVALAALICVATSPNPEACLKPDMFGLPFRIIRHYRGAIQGQTSLDPDIHKAADIWRAIIEPVVNDLGGLKLMRACHTGLLSWPSVAGADLTAWVIGLGHIVHFSDATGASVSDEQAWSTARCRAYLELPFLNAIAAGLERELRGSRSYAKEDIEENVAEYPEMCTATCRLLQFHLLALINRTNNPPVIDGRSIYVILSKCLSLLATFMRNEPQLPPDNRFMVAARRAFRDVCVELARMSRRDWKTDLQVIALRRFLPDVGAAASKEWYTEMHALRSLRAKHTGNPHYESLVESWAIFGKTFGLEETTQRDRHDAASKHFCSWLGCLFSTRPSTAQLSTCSGCGDRRYCSRECQKRDWKQGGHRESCRRIDARS